MELWSCFWHLCVCESVCVCVLTGEEVSVAVGLAASLLIVGHGRHLLGWGAAHGLTLWNLSSSHSHLDEDRDKHCKNETTSLLWRFYSALYGWSPLKRTVLFVQIRWPSLTLTNPFFFISNKLGQSINVKRFTQLLRFASPSKEDVLIWKFTAGSLILHLFVI